MKDLFKILAALIPLVKTIIKSAKGAKDAKEKQKIIEALHDGDVDKLNQLINK